MAKQKSKTPKAPFCLRQGDILVWADGQDVQTGAEIPRDNGAVVLAYGEETGHKHQIRESGVCHLRAEGIHADAVSSVTALLVEEHAWLAHEEHKLPVDKSGAPETGATPIAPGKYFVVRQSEYSPSEYRNVQD